MTLKVRITYINCFDNYRTAFAIFVRLTFTSIKHHQCVLVNVIRTLALSVPLIQRFMRISIQKASFIDSIHFLSYFVIR